MTRLLRFFAWVAVPAFQLCAAPAAWGADEPYPSRPIRMVVGFSPGSGTDTVARVVSKVMADQLSQSIVVENHAGAGGTIATDLVAKSRPDGYTLLTASSSIAISPGLYKSLPFDTEADLTPIGYIGALPTVLLINTKTIPARTLSDFVQFAKAHPDTLKYGSSGIGGSTHLFTELFQHLTGTQFRHIPYKGGSQDVTALRTGEVDLLFETLILALPILKEPDIIALAITGPSRSPTMPDVPTFTEAGMPQFQAEAYFGVLGPAKLPQPIVAKLNASLNEALRNTEVVSRLTGSGMRIATGTPGAYADRIRSDIATWRQLIKDANVPAQ